MLLLRLVLQIQLVVFHLELLCPWGIRWTQTPALILGCFSVPLLLLNSLLKMLKAGTRSFSLTWCPFHSCTMAIVWKRLPLLVSFSLFPLQFQKKERAILRVWSRASFWEYLFSNPLKMFFQLQSLKEMFSSLVLKY